MWYWCLVLVWCWYLRDRLEADAGGDVTRHVDAVSLHNEPHKRKHSHAAVLDLCVGEGVVDGVG